VSPRGGSRAGHPGVGGARKGAGRKAAPRDLAASRALLAALAGVEVAAELPDGAAARIAARVGVTRQAVSEAWRKGLTPNQLADWTARAK